MLDLTLAWRSQISNVDLLVASVDLLPLQQMPRHQWRRLLSHVARSASFGESWKSSLLF